MGKGTDKLYITHSEWSSDSAYSANTGAGAGSAATSRGADTSFKRLPYNFCAISLQPFTTPVCTLDGTVFDIDHILPWLEKHGTNPVTGQRLPVDDLVRLKITKNEQGEHVDPVTFKPFTNNTHLVAIRPSGNVFAYDTVHRLNLKAKQYRDLVTNEEFDGRKDLITIQDPQNLESRNLSSFKYVKEGVDVMPVTQRNGINRAALGNAASMITPTEQDTEKTPEVGKYLALARQASTEKGASPKPRAKGAIADNHKTSIRSTGQAAASLTSTGLTPHTSTALAQLSDEEYLLKRGRVKKPAFLTIRTARQGSLTLELWPEYAPKAVWNFIQLSKRGYYRNVIFHRNIRNFMIQTGDPTGTGRGGESCWSTASTSTGTSGKKTFEDEWPHSPLSHDARGIVAMANKGRDTNTSQFFILYRPAKHLDRKHTIFGRVVLEGGDASEFTLRRLEQLPVEEKTNRPLDEDDARIADVDVLIDPFEEALQDSAETGLRNGADDINTTEDELVTWTGKRVGAPRANEPGVGKYLHGASGGTKPVMEEWEETRAEPPKKKTKAGGFGNFDSW